MTLNKRWPIFALGLTAGLAVAFIAPRIIQRKNSPTSNEAPTHGKSIYQCPMHPSVVSDKPENCPICGMSLQKIDQAVPSGKGRILYYRNPMRPEVTSPKPTKDDMGMDYIPVFEGDEGQESSVSGHAVVKLPKWRQQLIGIKTTEVVRKPLVASIRTVGRIAYDPDLYTAMTEYKEALLSREKVKNSTWPDVQERANALVKASAMKLKLMGLGERQIEDLAKEQAPTNLLAGQAGGTVWVYAEVYESDAGLVSAGQAVEVTLPALPGQTLHGTIKAVDPVLNPTTRTLRVRAEIPDQQGRLKPEMFANVSIKIPLGERLAVRIRYRRKTARVRGNRRGRIRSSRSQSGTPRRWFLRNPFRA
jgi:Cu(I)/Ag(I) efflux system membrane fusion protein